MENYYDEYLAKHCEEGANKELFKKVAYMNSIVGFERFYFFKSRRDYILQDKVLGKTYWGLKEIKQVLKSIKVDK